MVSRIEQLINEIEEFIDSCKYQPLSNTKILVNKEELEELLVELRLRIPDEIKKYQKIISNQDAILNQARSQADAMLQEANAQTNGPAPWLQHSHMERGGKGREEGDGEVRDKERARACERRGRAAPFMFC